LAVLRRVKVKAAAKEMEELCEGRLLWGRRVKIDGYDDKRTNPGRTGIYVGCNSSGIGGGGRNSFAT
jgi:hypothetical protein